MSHRNRLNVFKNVCEMSGQSSIEKGMEGTGCPLLSTPADTLPGNRRVDAPRVCGAGGRVPALPPPTPPVSDAAPPQAVSGAGDVSGLAGGGTRISVRETALLTRPALPLWKTLLMHQGACDMR